MAWKLLRRLRKLVSVSEAPGVARMDMQLDPQYLTQHGFYLACHACDRLIKKTEMSPEEYDLNGGYCPDCFREANSENAFEEMVEAIKKNGYATLRLGSKTYVWIAKVLRPAYFKNKPNDKRSIGPKQVGWYVMGVEDNSDRRWRFQNLGDAVDAAAQFLKERARKSKGQAEAPVVLTQSTMQLFSYGEPYAFALLTKEEMEKWFSVRDSFKYPGIFKALYYGAGDAVYLWKDIPFKRGEFPED